MNCCQCEGIEKTFNDDFAADELRAYRKKGPAKSTRWLLGQLKEAGVKGLSLLDIGGGVGAIQFELLKEGLEHATSVEASTGFLNAAQQEAQRQDFAEQISYHHGNFVDLASEFEPADIVTLDRVLCCYHDMPALVEASARLAKRFYGVVFPRDVWWVKIGERLGNLGFWVARNPYRLFIHSTQEIEALLQGYGFTRRYYRRGFFWQVMLYAQQGAS